MSGRAPAGAWAPQRERTASAEANAVTRWIAIFSALLLVAIGACWWWASGGNHRVSWIYFGATRCADVEVRPWGFHATVAKYDRGFPTGQKQPPGPGWMFISEPSVARDMYSQPQFDHMGFGLGSYGRDELYGGSTRFVTIPYWQSALV